VIIVAGAGGDAGSAVCIALRIVELRGGEFAGATSGDAGRCDVDGEESLEELRECDSRGAGFGGGGLAAGPDTILERGERGGEPVLPVESDGDMARFCGEIVRAADVAWWRSVGGAVAIALALARLAAIAAAMLLFFVAGVGAPVDIDACPPGFGLAFSIALRFVASCASRIACARSGQSASNAQKATRPPWRALGFESASALRSVLSRGSSMPVDSIECRARAPCVSRYLVRCSATYARPCGTLSCKAFENSEMTTRGVGVVYAKMVVTDAWEACAVIFLTKPAILSRFRSMVSTTGSRAGPRAMASSLYIFVVLVTRVVRKLASCERTG
jgi:hypothetical protein